MLHDPVIRHKTAGGLGVQDDSLCLGVVPELPLKVGDSRFSELAAVSGAKGTSMAGIKIDPKRRKTGWELSVVLCRLHVVISIALSEPRMQFLTTTYGWVAHVGLAANEVGNRDLDLR